MSRKSVQRFCDNDMLKNRDLKRERESHKIATRFNLFSLQETIAASHAAFCGPIRQSLKTDLFSLSLN
jgi:hypothetical protein